jgi:hypothetical protein
MSCSFEDYFGMTEEQALEDVSIEPILGLHLAKKATSATTITTTTSPTTTSAPSILEQLSFPLNPPTPKNIDLELALLDHTELSKINRRKMVIDDNYKVDDADNEKDDDGYDAKDMDGEKQWNQKKQGKEVILVKDDLSVDNLENDAARQDATDRRDPHKPAVFNRMCTLLLFYIFQYILILSSS